MLKIYIPNNSKSESLSGGFQFINNIKKGSKGLFEIVNTWQECDIVLITSVTMTVRAEMEEAKKAGKKIVLRCDNMPKDSRNRGTAFSRMKDFAIMADWIVFQSKWAKDYVGWWLREKHKVSTMLAFHKTATLGPSVSEDHMGYFLNSVIYNGVDTNFFFHNDIPAQRRGNVYLYVQYNRDENKRFPEAAYYFHQQWRQRQNIELWCVGNFSPELVQYNFDFFAGETVRYVPPVSDRMELGNLMRKAKYLLFPAFADASSNTCSEAMACGVVPLITSSTGGTEEVVANCLNKTYTIQEMAQNYLSIFNKIIK